MGSHSRPWVWLVLLFSSCEAVIIREINEGLDANGFIFDIPQAIGFSKPWVTGADEFKVRPNVQKIF